MPKLATFSQVVLERVDTTEAPGAGCPFRVILLVPCLIKSPRESLYNSRRRRFKAR